MQVHYIKVFIRGRWLFWSILFWYGINWRVLLPSSHYFERHLLWKVITKYNKKQPFRIPFISFNFRSPCQVSRRLWTMNDSILYTAIADVAVRKCHQRQKEIIFFTPIYWNQQSCFSVSNACISCKRMLCETRISQAYRRQIDITT